VALSRRLRRVLRRLTFRPERFNPPPDAFVAAGIDPYNFRKREWRRILQRAGIGHRALKDLRDTFASQQLGHSDVATTARHYARWCGGSEYWEPLALEEGEVPADLLARFGATRVPTESPREGTGAEAKTR
jgi:integrase